MILGGVIVFCSLIIVGWGFPWSWEEPALKKDLDKHVEEADQRFDEGMEKIDEGAQRILDKLDKIQQAIEENSKK